MKLICEDGIRQVYVTHRAAVTWVPHSHPGWWAVRVRLGGRVWEIEVRYRRETGDDEPSR